MRNNFDLTNWTKTARKAATLGTAALVVAGTLASMKPAAAIPTSLMFYPSTDIQGMDTTHLNSSNYLDTGHSKSSASTSLGLTYGVGPDTSKAFGRNEIGFDYVTGGSAFASSISLGNRFLLNGKTQLYNNDKQGTRVVAGTWLLGARGNQTTGNTLFPADVIYLLGSKAFTFGRIHLGVAQSLANRVAITTPAGHGDRTYLQLGYDRSFHNNKLQFLVDYYSGRSTISTLSPSLLYNINSQSDVQIGYIHYNDSSVLPNRNQVYVGFDYNFGGPAAPAPAPPSTPTTGPAAAPSKTGGQ